MPHIRRLARRAAALAAAGCLGLAGTAAATPIETVVQDDALLLHGGDDAVRDAMHRIRALGFDRVRLTANWVVIAPGAMSAERPDFDARDPGAYPDGVWNHLDRAVVRATEAGLRPMIDIGFWAPRWATSEPEMTDRPRREVDPGHFGDFAAAVATRYGGEFAPAAPATAPAEPDEEPEPDLVRALLSPQGDAKTAEDPEPAPAGVPLPAVDLFTLWNEPNHQGFLMPQWAQENGRWVERAADLYRAMVHTGYAAVKGAAPHARVLVGGTASMGSSEPGRSGIPPLRFLRRLACVDAQLKPDTTGACAGFRPVPGDGWAHHPYSLRTTPDVVPDDPDKAPVGATQRLTRTLAKLVAAGRLAPGNADVYMTEYGYETRPHDPRAPFTEAEQPAMLAWAESLATRDPAVRMWPQFQLQDRPELADQTRRWSDWQSGLFDAQGNAKPAAAQWSRPVHARCVRVGRRRVVEIWARARGLESASVHVEEQHRGAWRAVASSADARRRAGMARSAAVGKAGTAVRRYVPRRRGSSYRVRWSAGGQVTRSLQVAPRSCR